MTFDDTMSLTYTEDDRTCGGNEVDNTCFQRRV